MGEILGPGSVHNPDKDRVLRFQLVNAKRPTGLGVEARRLWIEVTNEFELDHGDAVLLGEACHCLDELTKMRKAFAQEDIHVEGSTGRQRVNPLLATMTSHRGRLAALLAQILPSEEATASTSAAKLANLRWDKTRARRRGA
jgi:hypothetical protein